MSGMSPSGGGDFSARLQQALAKAKGQTSAAAPPAEASVPDPLPSADDFSERLGAAMRKARGEPEPTQAAAPEEQQTGPVGQGDYVVRPGDSMSSISNKTGFFWETIWNDPANGELKQVRQNPNVLLPADRLTIPEKRRKDEPLAPEQRHRFRRRGEPAYLRVQLCVANEPIAGQPYEIEVDGRAYPGGMTDANGHVDVPIPGDARLAHLTVGTDDNRRCYILNVGDNNPKTELVGAQKRLYNLGFTPIELDGVLGPLTEDALHRYQASRGLPETGRPDTATQDQLEAEHGS